jgi:twitching motility protein PilT
VQREEAIHYMIHSFDDIVRDAIAARASDIHVCAGYPVNVRVDGGIRPLYEEAELTAEEANAIADSIMNERQKDTLVNAGEVDFAYAIKDTARLRMNIYSQTGSVATCGRILNDRIPNLKSLGLPEILSDMCDKKRGLILVTGITGSGKSTTLAALIQNINMRHDHHILTIEEPIEYVYPRGRSVVNQREIGSDSKSFAAALRASLREDPDVILLGEMRDLETMQTAISAAETGHLVLSTLHTMNAAASIDRILDTFPPAQQDQVRTQLADVIECVVSQQLVPKIDGVGRCVATEIMTAVPAIRANIRDGKTYQIPQTIATSRKLGMHLMDDSLYDLYLHGKISGDSALYFAQDREAMSRKIF